MMKWRFKKAAQKLKYCIEKTYEVEVICLSIRRERQRFMFVLCHVEELLAIYKDPLLV